MPLISGGGGGGTPFNGGTVTGAVDFVPGAGVTPLEVDMPVGSRVAGTDWIIVNDESGNTLFECDGNGSFLVNMQGGGGRQTFQDGDGNAVLQLGRKAASSPDSTLDPSTGGTVKVGAVRGNTQIGRAAGTIGFYASAGTTKPTVAGAKLPSDVVLASLLTALAGLGLLTDSST